MAKYDKPIEDFHECPHCFSDAGFFQKHYVNGTIVMSKDFNGEYNCSETYDYLNWSRPSAFYFCLQCHERIARVKTIKR